MSPRSPVIQALMTMLVKIMRVQKTASTALYACRSPYPTVAKVTADQYRDQKSAQQKASRLSSCVGGVCRCVRHRQRLGPYDLQEASQSWAAAAGRQLDRSTVRADRMATSASMLLAGW